MNFAEFNFANDAQNRKTFFREIFFAFPLCDAYTHFLKQKSIKIAQIKMNKNTSKDNLPQLLLKYGLIILYNPSIGLSRTCKYYLISPNFEPKQINDGVNIFWHSYNF